MKVTGTWDWIVGFGLDFCPNESLKIKDIHIRDHFAKGYQSAALFVFGGVIAENGLTREDGKGDIRRDTFCCQVRWWMRPMD